MVGAATILATGSSRLTATPIARSTIRDGFKVQAKTDLIHVRLESKGPIDVVVNNNTLAPGGYVGWHSHNGPVFVQIRKGAMTLYGPDCQPHVVYADDAFVENITNDDEHTVHNEGVENLEWTSTALLPVGYASRVDEPQPATCSID